MRPAQSVSLVKVVHETAVPLQLSKAPRSRTATSRGNPLVPNPSCRYHAMERIERRRAAGIRGGVRRTRPRHRRPSCADRPRTVDVRLHRRGKRLVLLLALGTVGTEQPPKTQTSVVQAAMALGVAGDSAPPLPGRAGPSTSSDFDASMAAVPLLPHPSAVSENITIRLERAIIETSAVSTLRYAHHGHGDESAPDRPPGRHSGRPPRRRLRQQLDDDARRWRRRPPRLVELGDGDDRLQRTPPCITQPLVLVGGQAQCTVVEHRTATGGVIDTNVPSCDTASQGPCWSLITSPSTCPGGGLTFTFDPDPANPNPNPSTISFDYSCELRSS